MSKTKYEIYLKQQEKFVESFESSYPYQVGQDVFVKVDGNVKRINIIQITHNHTGEEPVTRLNGVFKKYEK